MRVGQQKNDAFEAPNIDGPSGSNQNGFIDVASTAVRRRRAPGSLGPTSVLDARLGVSRIDAGKKPPVIGGPSMFELYGITGLPENDPALTGGLTPQTITGYSQLGRQATNPQFQNPFNVNPRVSLTNVLGRHSLKVGFEYPPINTEVQDTNPLYGLDTYSSQFSRPAGAAANNQYNLADFYFGARTQYELASLIVAQMRQRALLRLPAGRRPRSTSTLTLNLGLRYEYVTPYYEAENRLSNFDPATNTIVTATRRVDRRPRAGRSRSQQLRAALRLRLSADRGHGACAAATASATSTSTASRAPACWPPTIPIVTRATVTQSLTRDADGTAVIQCTGDQFAGCFRTTQQGYRAEPAEQRRRSTSRATRRPG